MHSWSAANLSERRKRNLPSEHHNIPHSSPSPATPSTSTTSPADMAAHQYYSESQKRAALLGNSGSSRRPWGQSDQVYQEHAEQMFEEQNDALVSDLHDRVNALKSLSLDIGTEIRSQNDYLAGIDFDHTTGALDGVMKSLNTMINTGGSRHMCYLTMFIVLVFFIVYFMIR